MTIHLRIDNRLIHGQVTTTWTKAVKANSIIVADDASAIDEMQKILLKMAAGATDSEILNINDASSYINLNKDKNLLIICKNVSDAYKLVRQGTYIDQCNIGNQAKKPDIESEQFSRSVFLSKDDLSECIEIKKIIQTHITIQMMPTDKAVELKTK